MTRNFITIEKEGHSSNFRSWTNFNANRFGGRGCCFPQHSFFFPLFLPIPLCPLSHRDTRKQTLLKEQQNVLKVNLQSVEFSKQAEILVCRRICHSEIEQIVQLRLSNLSLSKIQPAPDQKLEFRFQSTGILEEIKLEATLNIAKLYRLVGSMIQPG